MDPIIGAGTGNVPGGQPPANTIKDGSTATFREDVIDPSMTTPVIVDFWAPWCGPCKQLGPALEKAVQGAKGAVRMVKINVDENQELAAQLKIQSIPTVYAFFQGQPVDGFVGAQAESDVKGLVDRMAKQGGGPGNSAVDQALEQAQEAFDGEQMDVATSLFSQVLQHDPDNQTAMAGVIRCQLALGNAAGAREMFDSLPAEITATSALASIAAALDLAEQGADASAIPELLAKLAQDHNDHQTRFDLAMALHAAGKGEAAADALLEIVQRNRSWNDEAARKQLVKFFEAWGPTDPLTHEFRRRLSSVLFS